MPAPRIVEPFHVIEHIGPRLVPRGVPSAARPFRLQRREEALHGGVVPAVAAPAHATDNAVVAQQALEVLAGVLAALVRVVQQLVRPAAPPQRHQQGVSHQLRRHRGTHRPADDAPRVQVQHCRHEEPAFRRPEVGEVGHPFAVWRIGLELPLQHVGGDAVLGAHTGVGRAAPALAARLQARRLHQPGHALLAASLARIVQVAPDAGRTIGPVARLEALADAPGQPQVLPLPAARRAAQPFVETARRDFHDPTHRPRRPDRAVPGDESVPHVGSFAK